MEIKDAGFSTPGSATLPPSPQVTPDTLRQDLGRFFGPRGYEIAILGANVVLEKSRWTWVAINILHEPRGTTLRFGAALSRSRRVGLAVSAAVVGVGLGVLRVIGVLHPLGGFGWFGEIGMIPLTLIGMVAGMPLVLLASILAYFNAEKPLLTELRGYLAQSPLLHSQPQEDGSGALEEDAQEAAPVAVKAPVEKKGAFVLLPVLVVATLGLALVGSQLGGGETIRDWLSPPTRTERATRQHWQGLKDMEAFKRRVGGRGPAEARALGEQITRTGLKRLAPADLDRWNQLRQALATQSRGVCAGLWTGNFVRGEVEATVEKLADPDLDDWARVSATAMRLELEAMAPDLNDPLVRALDPAYGAALRRTINQLLAPLPEADAQRVRRAFAAGVALGDDEACWAMQTMMKTAAELPPETREEVLRTLAAL